jgi:hypothetical protein
MRVLVCGSRDWTDAGRILKELLAVEYAHDAYVTEVIHGGAGGADTLSGVAARKMCGYGKPKAQVKKNTPKITVFPADWKKHGRAAGFIRNQQMLDEGKPDLVLAFWKNKSRGTEDMIRRARKAGVEVRVIEP